MAPTSSSSPPSSTNKQTNSHSSTNDIADKDAVIYILERERNDILNYKDVSEIVAYENKLQDRDILYNSMDDSNSNDENVKKRNLDFRKQLLFFSFI